MEFSEFIYQLLLIIGVIVVFAFIKSTFGYISHSRKIRKDIKQEEYILSTTWGCPRCRERVPNGNMKCKCGQPIHNSGRMK